MDALRKVDDRKGETFNKLMLETTIKGTKAKKKAVAAKRKAAAPAKKPAKKPRAAKKYSPSFP